MGKKKGGRKKSALPKGWRASPQQVEAWLDKTEQQLMGERYKGAVQTARQSCVTFPRTRDLAAKLCAF